MCGGIRSRRSRGRRIRTWSPVRPVTRKRRPGRWEPGRRRARAGGSTPRPVARIEVAGGVGGVHVRRGARRRQFGGRRTLPAPFRRGDEGPRDHVRPVFAEAQPAHARTVVLRLPRGRHPGATSWANAGRPLRQAGGQGAFDHRVDGVPGARAQVDDHAVVARQAHRIRDDLRPVGHGAALQDAQHGVPQPGRRVGVGHPQIEPQQVPATGAARAAVHEEESGRDQRAGRRHVHQHHRTSGAARGAPGLPQRHRVGDAHPQAVDLHDPPSRRPTAAR